MATTTINGQLEVDHDRGVIYFHAGEGPFAGGTILRISKLPTPIPAEGQLDITHMHGVNWAGAIRPDVGTEIAFIHRASRRKAGAALPAGGGTPRETGSPLPNAADARRTGRAEDARGDEFEPQ